jgi:hypothetical protein
MSLTTYDEIRKEILDDWEQLARWSYPEDILTEWADNTVPIYTNEIIDQWRELPNEYNDSWEEYGLPHAITITTLMTLSLYHYYQNQFTQIYHEILLEKEQAEDN